MRRTAAKMLQYLLEHAPRAQDGTLFHLDHKPQVWLDSLYMVPTFLAVIGHPLKAVRQIGGMRRRLWQRQHRLFAHLWNESRQDLELTGAGSAARELGP